MPDGSSSAAPVMRPGPRALTVSWSVMRLKNFMLANAKTGGQQRAGALDRGQRGRFHVEANFTGKAPGRRHKMARPADSGRARSIENIISLSGPARPCGAG